MLEIIKSPWSCFVVGPLIGLTVSFLLLMGYIVFGISASLRLFGISLSIAVSILAFAVSGTWFFHSSEINCHTKYE